MVGACGAGLFPDCPLESWHQILCCTLPYFSYGHCSTYGSDHGAPNNCLDHGEMATMLEGTCGSGKVCLFVFLSIFCFLFVCS